KLSTAAAGPRSVLACPVGRARARGGSAWAVRGRRTDSIRARPAVRRTACCHGWCRMPGAATRAEGFLDPLAGDVLLAVDAMHVDGLQDADAVPGPCGDFAGRGARVQPEGHGGVPQVVRPAGERGGGQDWAERSVTGGVPDPAVQAFAEHAAAGAAEQPPVRRRAVITQVPAQEGDE